MAGNRVGRNAAPRPIAIVNPNLVAASATMGPLVPPGNTAPIIPAPPGVNDDTAWPDNPNGGTKSTMSLGSSDGGVGSSQYAVTFPGSGNLVNVDPGTGDYTIVNPQTGKTIATGNMYDNNNGDKSAGKIPDPSTGNIMVVNPATGTCTTVGQKARRSAAVTCTPIRRTAIPATTCLTSRTRTIR